MKNFKILSIISFLWLSLFSCSSSDDGPTYQAITGVPQSIEIPAQASRDYSLKGGDNVYIVSSENTQIAKASVSGNKLTVTALSKGSTTLVIKSANKELRIKVVVEGELELGILSNNENIATFVYSVQSGDELVLMDNVRSAQAKKLFLTNWNSEVQEGNTITVNVKSSDFSQLQVGALSAKVEHVVGDKVSLKIGGVKLMLPKN